MIRIVLLLLSLFMTHAFAQERHVELWPRAFLLTGEHLKVNQYMRSANGAFFAVLLSNGHFAVYKGSKPGDEYGVLWNTDRATVEKAYYAQVNDDGNFAVWKGSGPGDNHGIMWHANVFHEKNQPYYLVMQDDGNLGVYRGTPGSSKGYIWSAPGHATPITWAKDGAYLHVAGQKREYVYLGYHPAQSVGAYKDWRMWVGERQFAQRFALQPDGTIRWGPDSSKCLDFSTTDPDSFTNVNLETCNGSEVQKAGRITRTIKRSRTRFSLKVVWSLTIFSEQGGTFLESAGIIASILATRTDGSLSRETDGGQICSSHRITVTAWPCRSTLGDLSSTSSQPPLADA